MWLVLRLPVHHIRRQSLPEDDLCTVVVGRAAA
jgi:hypothetical protein